MQWDGRRFVAQGSITRDREEQIYQLSGVRMQSLCGGQCGWKRDAAFIGYWHEADQEHSGPYWKG
jgi:hypothetical protein